MLAIGAALRQGAELLERGGVEAPRLTAEVLLAHALKRERVYLYTYPELPLKEVEWIHYGRYLHERLQHKPTQYITRVQEFYGRSFRVTADVLIPRPETELLVEVALPFARAAESTIDVGTGSGALAITLALEGARHVIGTDLSHAALAVAQHNAQTYASAATLVCADILTVFADSVADLIVSNPPYVAESERSHLQPEVRDWEPPIALYGGPSGLEFYRRLIPEASRVLRPGGRLALELGFGQAADVTSLFGAAWEISALFPDLAGIDRVLIAGKK